MNSDLAWAAAEGDGLRGWMRCEGKWGVKGDEGTQATGIRANERFYHIPSSPHSPSPHSSKQSS